MLELYSFGYGGTMERDREAAEVHELLTRPSAGERWGTSLNYVRRGSGDPLLLLHSLGGSLVQWSPVIDALAAEREVIAVDMPGFGASPPLPDGVEPSSANLATAVLDFYESLEVEGAPDVAGISPGGWTAIE